MVISRKASVAKSLLSFASCAHADAQCPGVSQNPQKERSETSVLEQVVRRWEASPHREEKFVGKRKSCSTHRSP